MVLTLKMALIGLLVSRIDCIGPVILSGTKHSNSALMGTSTRLQNEVDVMQFACLAAFITTFLNSTRRDKNNIFSSKGKL
jgi:hypothetical protein